MTINQFEKLRQVPSAMRFALAIGLATAQAAAAEPDSAASAPILRLFASEAEAHAHCPADKAIRIELPDGFFLHGDRGFGGASLDHVYICRDEVTRLFGRQGG